MTSHVSASVQGCAKSLGDGETNRTCPNLGGLYSLPSGRPQSDGGDIVFVLRESLVLLGKQKNDKSRAMSKYPLQSFLFSFR